jgi:hypothetical protein
VAGPVFWWTVDVQPRKSVSTTTPNAESGCEQLDVGHAVGVRRAAVTRLFPPVPRSSCGYGWSTTLMAPDDARSLATAKASTASSSG